MEKKRKSMPLLGLLAFSVVIISVALTSCGEEYREDYSFRNELDKDIFLKVYSSNTLLREIDGLEIEIGSMEQALLLVNVSEHFRSGAGANYISQLADSISVTIVNNNEQIVFWRKGGQHYYGNNYVDLPDIFNANEAPWQYNSIGKNHEEYYYLLSVED